jgi:hypothetical protein
MVENMIVLWGEMQKRAPYFNEDLVTSAMSQTPSELLGYRHA